MSGAAEGFESLVPRFTASLLARGYAAGTLELKARGLGLFAAWCAERGITRPLEVTRDVVERFARHLVMFRKTNGEALNVTTRYLRLSTLRQFFKWLVKQGQLLHNPTTELELPRIPRRLPRDVLSASEAEQLMAMVDISTAHGMRNRVMLELFYSSGLRRLELVSLRLADVDFERGVLVVRRGKGGHERAVPLGERAGMWLRKYLAEVRPTLVHGHDTGFVFLTVRGARLHKNSASVIVKKLLVAAGIQKMGCCHLLRHTTATVMLEHGADIRYVQELLGHAKLETTQVYTHVAIGKLKEVHARTHPGANLKTPRQDGQK